jgi:hypothetical protein
MSDATKQSRPYRPLGGPGGWALLIVVCVVGGGVGALFGSFDHPKGTILGALGGVVAGALWTGIMLLHAWCGLSGGGLVGAGTLWGIGVGLLATFILHGGLAVWDPKLGYDGAGMIYLEIGLACAIPAGAITGAVCGTMVPDN